MADLEARIRDLEAELANVRGDLKRAKDEFQGFVSLASHDFRAPLRAIGTCSQILLEDYEDVLDGDGKDSLGHIAVAARRLESLVDALVGHARIDRVWEAEAVDVDGLLQSVLSRLDDQATAAEAQIERAESGARVWCDPIQLAMALECALVNALTYTQSPPRVSVAVERDGADWQVRIADQGLGIAAEYVERVFEPFERLHSRDEYPGVGMGLANLRKVATLAGGRAWIESTPGAGTTVFLTLPAAKEAPGA